MTRNGFETREPQSFVGVSGIPQRTPNKRSFSSRNTSNTMILFLFFIIFIILYLFLFVLAPEDEDVVPSSRYDPNKNTTILDSNDLPPLPLWLSENYPFKRKVALVRGLRVHFIDEGNQSERLIFLMFKLVSNNSI